MSNLKELDLKTDVPLEGATLDFRPREYVARLTLYLTTKNDKKFDQIHHNAPITKLRIERSEIKDKGNLVALIQCVEDLQNRNVAGLQGYERVIISYDENYISNDEVLRSIDMNSDYTITDREITSFNDSIRSIYPNKSHYLVRA